MKNTEIYLVDWYTENHPEDLYGASIESTATFHGLLRCLEEHKDVYKYIGVGDSLIRERLFGKLAKVFGIEIEGIYKLWHTWA